MKSLLLLSLISFLVSSKLVWLADMGNTGARYPINDMYDGNESVSLQGQLNSVGMRQQYLLGTYLRSDYINE